MSLFYIKQDVKNRDKGGGEENANVTSFSAVKKCVFWGMYQNIVTMQSEGVNKEL